MRRPDENGLSRQWEASKVATNFDEVVMHFAGLSDYEQ